VFAIVGSDLVFKELNARACGLGGLEWATGAVDFWESLSASEKGFLSSVAVWPSEIVEDQGRVVGIVMPKIPAAFWHTSRQFDGSDKTFDNQFKWLMQVRKGLAGRSLDVDSVTDDAVKFQLLSQVANAIAWLHARGVVFGDISQANEVFALHPPRMLLLDCDAVSTSPTTRQAKGRHSPAYVPPEHERVLTTVSEATDVYKLAVLILGVLTPGPGATQRKPNHLRMLDGRIPNRLYELLKASLASTPSARPSAADIAQCLTDIATRLTQPPVANRLELKNDVVRRGDTVSIRWDFDVASLITVEAPGGVTIDVDYKASPTGCVFVATESGLVAVHATNRHGTATFAVGPIAVYDVPNAKVSLPEIDIPSASTRSRPFRRQTALPMTPNGVPAMPVVPRTPAAPRLATSAPIPTPVTASAARTQALRADASDLASRLRAWRSRSR
jgi:hypothetical protein